MSQWINKLIPWLLMKQSKLFTATAIAKLTYLGKDLNQRRQTKGLASNDALSDPTSAAEKESWRSLLNHINHRVLDYQAWWVSYKSQGPRLPGLMSLRRTWLGSDKIMLIKWRLELFKTFILTVKYCYDALKYIVCNCRKREAKKGMKAI